MSRQVLNSLSPRKAILLPQSPAITGYVTMPSLVVAVIYVSIFYEVCRVTKLIQETFPRAQL